MATNPFFKQNIKKVSSSVVEDLTIESIKIHGMDMIYIPRVLVKEDTLFGEDIASKFTDGNKIEMYIESADGFGGEGDQQTQFGFELRDTIELVVSKKRFKEVFAYDEVVNRPREGDVIYFPLSKGLFEIKFVEHENPFYQLGKNYTYKLSCELFRYSSEILDTGFDDVDKLEDTVMGSSADGIYTPQGPSGDAGENSDIEGFGDNIFDFTETDPFSEGNYR